MSWKYDCKIYDWRFYQSDGRCLYTKWRKNLPDKLEELKSATSPKMFEENADKWLRHSIYETQKGRPFSFLTSIILIGLHGQNKQTLLEGFVCSVFVVFIYSLRLSGLL